jgi:hypothetical protein
MTRFTVVWDRNVEIPFMKAWILGNSQTRAVLSAVANWLDANLAEDPDTKGEPRPEQSARQIDVPIPGSSSHVLATFQVLADDRQVRVVRLVFRGA